MPVDEGLRPAWGHAASDLEYHRVVHCSWEIEGGFKGNLAVWEARLMSFCSTGSDVPKTTRPPPRQGEPY